MSVTATVEEDDSIDLPDREWGWKEIDSPFGDDVSLYQPDQDRIETNRSNYSSVKQGVLAYVPEGLSGFEDYELTELDVPKYYSRFEEFDVYPTQLDTQHNRGVGLGVTSKRLEDAIRVVTGGGRYRSGDLAAYAIEDERCFVVTYDGEAWVVACDHISNVPDDYDTTEVRGFTVPKDSEVVLRGMKRFLDLVPEHYDEELVAYSHLSDSGYHHFERADGSEVSINGIYLKKLGQCAWTEEEVTTEYEIETEYDETYELSWDDVEYDIGDPPRNMDDYPDGYMEDRSHRECVAGYQMRWEDPRTSSRVSMNGKITARATYYYLRSRENSNRYEVRDKKETIAKFDPEKKDWSPLSGF